VNRDGEDKKRGTKTALDNNNYGKLNNVYDDQLSLNSYVYDNDMKSNKPKRLRSCSNYAYEKNEEHKPSNNSE
jgi:hypothetical protein